LQEQRMQINSIWDELRELAGEADAVISREA
jgi:hypothetical protein